MDTVRIIDNKYYLLMKIATSLYVVYSVLHSSCFVETKSIAKWIIESMLLVSVFLFTYIWLKYAPKSLWSTLFALFVFVMPIYLYNLGTYRTFDLYLILAMSAGYSFTLFLKTLVKWGTATLFFVIILSLIGFLPDAISSREDLMLIDTTFSAHTFGFIYRGSPAYLSMGVLIAYLYLNRFSMNYKRYLLYVLCSLLTFFVFVTRLQIIVNLIVLVFYYLSYQCHIIRFYSAFWKWVSLLGYPLMMYIFYLIFSSPDYDFIQEDELLNQIFSARLLLNQGAFEQYDVNAWGNFVETSNGEDGSAYFYIDSGYVATLLRFGWFFSVIIMLLYSMAFYNIYKSRNTFLYFWMLVFMFFSTVNNFVLSIVYLPLLILSSAKSLNSINDKKIVTYGENTFCYSPNIQYG